MGRGSRCAGLQFPHLQRGEGSLQGLTVAAGPERRPVWPPPPRAASSPTPPASPARDLLPRAAHAHDQQRAGRRHGPQSRSFPPSLGARLPRLPGRGGRSNTRAGRVVPAAAACPPSPAFTALHPPHPPPASRSPSTCSPPSSLWAAGLTLLRRLHKWE